MVNIRQGYSKKNSVTKPLLAREERTNPWEIINDPQVMISAKADQPCYIFFEFSNDGQNVVSTYPTTSYKMEANIPIFHIAAKGSRYFRTRVLSVSDVNMTSVDIGIYYGNFGFTVSPIDQSIPKGADGIVVRSVDASLDLAFGKFGGMDEDAKHGEVVAIEDADAPVDIWQWGSDVNSGARQKTFPSTAQSLYLLSDNANDDGKTARITYIDADGYEDVTDMTITGAGLIQVKDSDDVNASGLDVNRIRVIGSNLEGNLYISTSNSHSSGVPSSANTVLAFVQAGYDKTEQCLYTVPIDKRVRIKWAIIKLTRASGAAGSAEVFLRRYADGAWFVERVYQISDSEGINSPQAGIVLEGGEKFALTVEEMSQGDSDFNFNGELHMDILDA